jgi:hypothetical protein
VKIPLKELFQTVFEIDYDDSPLQGLGTARWGKCGLQENEKFLFFSSQ